MYADYILSGGTETQQILSVLPAGIAYASCTDKQDAETLYAESLWPISHTNLCKWHGERPCFSPPSGPTVQVCFRIADALSKESTQTEAGRVWFLPTQP